MRTNESWSDKMIKECTRNYVLFSGRYESYFDDYIEQMSPKGRAWIFKQEFTLLSYDPETKTAEIRGQSSNVYTTSDKSCTCPDFQKRLKPCKHMYWLANWYVENEYGKEND